MTGAATFCYSSWFSLRAKKRLRHRDHIAAHVTASRLLNAAVAVNVDVKKGKDSIYMREHVKRVQRNFAIRDWPGDSAYLSRENCTAVAKAGGKPWFRTKKNTTAKHRGSKAWGEMVKEFKNNPDAWEHYHKRSNSESANSAKKRKFGSFVRSKDDAAKENEEHLGWVAYNFSVLSRARYVYKIKPKF